MTGDVVVVIPAYQAGSYLADAVASARAQAFDGLTIVVVDDGSTDDTPAVAASLAGDDLRYVRQENAGPAAARNMGIATSEAPLIAFLDADDLWPPGKLARQVAVLRDDPGVDVVLGRTSFFGDVASAPVRSDRSDGSVAGPFVGAGVFRRSAFERVGVFDESMRMSEDYDWLLRAREAGLHVRRTEDVAHWYRVHPGGMTRDQDTGNRAMADAIRRSLARRRSAGGPR